MDISKFEAIIFDLGGVILNIDHEAPVKAFAELGIPDFDQLYSKVIQTTLFTNLETGVISPAEFRDKLRVYLPVDLADETIDKAWNAIILDFPEERIRLLERLKSQHRVFLLSNTNTIHHQLFSGRLLRDFGYTDIGDLMEKAYYSHELGMRKPDPAIFRHVIEDAGLNPKRTLFIDDTEEHIRAAASVGLHTYHLKEEDSIKALFAQAYEN